jgi:dolichol kinase
MPQTIVVRTQSEQNKIEADNIKLFLTIILLVGLSVFLALYPPARWIVGVIIVLIIFLVVRKKRRYNWKKINRLPNWAYRRMKRKRKNIIRGEHYLYKREGNSFYRKLTK